MVSLKAFLLWRCAFGLTRRFFQSALQLRLQFGVAEPGEDAACAVETHIFEAMVSVALFTPATYTVRTPYIHIKATAG